MSSMSDPATIFNNSETPIDATSYDENVYKKPSGMDYKFMGKVVGGFVLLCILIMLLQFALFGIVYIAGDDNSVKYCDKTMIQTAGHYAKSLKHLACKLSGGCADSCPYMDSSDPRMMIPVQIAKMEALKLQLVSDFNDNAHILANAVAEFSESQRVEATNKMNMYKEIKTRSIAEIKNIIYFIDNVSSNLSGAINSDLVKMWNRVNAAEAMVNIHRNAFTSATIQSNAYVMWDKVRLASLDTTASKQTYFENLYTDANTHYNSLSNSNGLLSSFGTKASYKSLYDTIISNETTADSVLAAMASIITELEASNKELESSAKNYNALHMIYTKMESYGKEEFNNDLPGKLSMDTLGKMIEDGNYTQALIQTALEPEILVNHKKFAAERGTFDSGGGVHSVRDDDNDLNPWVGLFGRPSYRKSNGRSIEESSEPLRSIPSNDMESMTRASSPRIVF